MTPYTFTDVVNGFLTYNCNTMNVYSATTSTAGITLTYYIGGGSIIQAITKIALDCSLIDASFLTYNIVIDTLNSDPTALAAAVETIDVVNY